MNETTAIIAEVKNMLRSIRGETVESIDHGEDFIASLYLESIQVIELVLQIEQRFDIEFGDEPQVLVSLDRLAQHIASRVYKDAVPN